MLFKIIFWFFARAPGAFSSRGSNGSKSIGGRRGHSCSKVETEARGTEKGDLKDLSVDPSGTRGEEGKTKDFVDAAATEEGETVDGGKDQKLETKGAATAGRVGGGREREVLVASVRWWQIRSWKSVQSVKNLKK